MWQPLWLLAFLGAYGALAQPGFQPPFETARQQELRKEWQICTRVCRAAAGGRMALDGGYAGAFTVQCWNRNSNNGILRVLDFGGVSLIAYQPCAYMSGKTPKPLWLSMPSRERYRMVFENPKRADGRKVFLEVSLVGDV
uniref:Uncharacterized protein n=1 Tax=Zooxanthella nutricula TaxID=1333877 RepID=A0A6U6UD78_9DINO|mmetsp:Transcript_84131/g.257019  ORF Transcript_84131/g.257019 Transcript_84131/m.257019 type:complete len:140 (+) Transcript_84131:81-500(+)